MRCVLDEVKQQPAV